MPPKRAPKLEEVIPKDIIEDDFKFSQYLWDLIASHQCQCPQFKQHVPIHPASARSPGILDWQPSFHTCPCSCCCAAREYWTARERAGDPIQFDIRHPYNSSAEPFYTYFKHLDYEAEREDAWRRELAEREHRRRADAARAYIRSKIEEGIRARQERERLREEQYNKQLQEWKQEEDEHRSEQKKHSKELRRFHRWLKRHRHCGHPHRRRHYSKKRHNNKQCHRHH